MKEQTEQVLLGSLLGDGSLIKQQKSVKAHFVETHSIKQKEYLLSKNNILQNELNMKVREFEGNGKNKGKKYIEIRSLCSPLLDKYYNLFYYNKKKRVTIKILNMLKPLSLAIWFCDDGCYAYLGKNVMLSTNGFNKEGNEIIKEYFLKKFDVLFKIQKSNKSLVLRTTSKVEANKFIEIVKPYIIKSMEYKIGKDKKRIKRSIEVIKSINKSHEIMREIKCLGCGVIFRGYKSLKCKICSGKERSKEYNKKHKDYFKEWYKNNRKEAIKKSKIYYEKNKERCKYLRRKRYERDIKNLKELNKTEV